MVYEERFAGKLPTSFGDNSLPANSLDDYPDSVPAAGNRNESSLNNAGDNGNYWSSTVNDNSNNAYNLNFNSDNHNVNNNNRNNGQSVRPVTEFIQSITDSVNLNCFSIDKERLLKDLYIAYKDARRHKHKKIYVLRFEFNLEENLIALRDELIEGRYRPARSDCFIIHDPKMREVFAARFRDRIVHHLFYNYTYRLFERTFIYDSYSCLKGKGTHFGIERLKHHIRSVSSNFSQPCYVLKIDIRGYFMSIDRQRLWNICNATLDSIYRKGGDCIVMPDLNFVKFLLERILFTNPVEDCRVVGEMKDWDNLPREKSLFCSERGCGLPIGNLSSQLFSNVYLNTLDQYVKRVLEAKHYGRYVDDAYIVDNDRDRLKQMIGKIGKFLDEMLGLQINPGKTRIYNAKHGIEFLGAYIKPFRTYISTSSLSRIKRKLHNVKYSSPKQLQCSINSFLGVFSHYDSYCVRKQLFIQRYQLNRFGQFDNKMLRFYPFANIIETIPET